MAPNVGFATCSLLLMSEYSSNCFLQAQLKASSTPFNLILPDHKLNSSQFLTSTEFFWADAGAGIGMRWVGEIPLIELKMFNISISCFWEEIAPTFKQIKRILRHASFPTCSLLRFCLFWVFQTNILFRKLFFLSLVCVIMQIQSKTKGS